MFFVHVGVCNNVYYMVVSFSYTVYKTKYFIEVKKKELLDKKYLWKLKC